MSSFFVGFGAFVVALAVLAGLTYGLGSLWIGLPKDRFDNHSDRFLMGIAVLMVIGFAVVLGILFYHVGELITR